MHYDNIFSTPTGRAVYQKFERAVSDFSMNEYLSGGVLVGFSGGADSVLLLLLLNEYRRRWRDFKILAFHVNHLIRGEEAYRDESFAEEFARSIGVEFSSVKVDVPRLSKEMGCGLEEAARDVRYSEFEKILQGRTDISSIATAHNSTDNLETVIINMMRGAGSRGISGIKPVRKNILRPIIYVSKEEVVRVLNEANVPFAIDSTNLTTDYKRNYVRHEILPRLSTLTSSAEEMAIRFSENLRCDADYIDSVAFDFIEKNYRDGKVARAALSALHPAVFSRVIISLAKEVSGVSLEKTHLNAIFSHLDSGDFSISLPGEVSFIARADLCYFGKNNKEEKHSYSKSLVMGINEIEGFDGVIILSDTPIDKTFIKVFKIATQVRIDSAIIDGELRVRSKIDGDSYRYGGITRKLKKVFNDKSVPREIRFAVPVICDGKGILWVPGLPVRDGGNANASNLIYAALAYKIDTKKERPYKLYKV